MDASKRVSRISGVLNPPRDVYFEVESPRRWPSRWKWTNVILISFQAALTPIAATILSVASYSIVEDFKLKDPYTPNLPLGTFLLGNSTGPLYLAPLSETFGRRTVYIFCFTLFALFNVGCALSPSIAALCILRFFSGLAGSAASTLSTASVGDLFEPHERGRAQSLVGVVSLLGPVIGGIMSGFVTHGTGTWRWNMWVMAIAPGISVVTCILFLGETYEPVIRRKALRKYNLLDTNREARYTDLWRLLGHSIKRPLRLLFTSPACAIMSIYSGFAFGVYYIHVVTLSLLFTPHPKTKLGSYRWENGTEGLSYLGIGVGSLIGLILASLTTNRLYSWTRSRIIARQLARERGVEIEMANFDPRTISSNSEEPLNNVRAEGVPSNNLLTEMENRSYPEARLLGLLLAQVLSLLGLLIFGLTAGPLTPWIAPLIGAAIFAVGLVTGHISIQTYLIDAYEQYSASAIAVASVVGNVIAAVLSVVGWAVYMSLGYIWGSLIIVFIFIFFVVIIPVPLWKWSKALRRLGRVREEVR